MRVRRSTVRAFRPAPVAPCTVGRVVEVSATGETTVDFPGNEAGPLRARTVRTAPEAVGAPVLLVFEGGNPNLPIILGSPHDVPPASAAVPPASLETRQDVTVRTESLVLDARRQIVLRCGQGSITVEADGRIVVRGTQLVSRSSGTNRIKGAAVQIN